MKCVPHRGEQTAFSLVEVTIALGVVSFCLVAILGLLPIGLSNNKFTIQQTAATSILSSVISDLHAIPSGATQSVQYEIELPDVNGEVRRYFGANGEWSRSINAQSLYLLTLKTLNNSAGTKTIFLNMQVSWPAQADVKNAAGTVETFVAINSID